QGVEVRIHAHEGLDQALHLLGDPADLLPADRVERPGEALVQREQVRDVANAALAEPAHQLAVVAHQLLGLATDVDRHDPSRELLGPRVDARRLGGLHPPPPVRQQENEPAAAPRPGAMAPFDATRVEQFVELQRDLLLVGGDPTGALHLVAAATAPLTDRGLELGRALAGLAGVALTNARQCGRLAQIARMKGDALTTMAHDLRAPLNALVGYAGLLGEGALGPLAAEQRDICSTLERQALELVDLLGAALDVARLETGSLPIRSDEFALGELLATLQSGTFARATREGRLTCRVPPDLPRLRTDRVKVKEIVQNLVDNALKHGGGRAVEVEVTLAPEHEAVRLTVRDAGSGIAAEVLPHLFEPFHPGRGPERGTGFGLYIVRSFAEALGGRVAARSRLDEGTAVTVELPLVAPARHALSGAPPARRLSE